MALKKNSAPERAIEMEILGFLRMINVFCWKTDRQGTFDPVKKVFRKNHNPYKIKGVADILGVIQGRFIAIEVKSPSGSLTPEQRAFLARVNNEGGIGIVARSLVGFLEELMKHFPQNKAFQDLAREYIKSGGTEH